MLPTTLLALLTLPLLVLSASPHNSRSGRPHANLASSVNNNQKRIYGLPVQMDTIIPGNSPSLDARKIVVPDHITEEDLYRRELFLSRQKREAAGGEVETGGRMLRKRASCSSKTTAAAAPPATNKVMHAVSTTAKADTPASTAVTYKSGWTSASTNGQSLAVTPLQHISLAEAVKATKGETPSFSNAPDGSWALAANYKAGGVGYDAGWSYYANGPVDISSAREVELTYKVFFANGFTWVKGGKLPGMYGGVGSATGCSGGDQASRDVCFSARVMWREKGAAELYTYLPLSNVNTEACRASGSKSVCDNQTYGLSFGRGNSSFKSGSWVTVKERTRLNDVGKANGYIHLTVDGNTAIKADNVEIRKRNDAKFEGVMMSSFFGGASASYAPSSSQQAWFKDFTLGVIA